MRMPRRGVRRGAGGAYAWCWADYDARLWAASADEYYPDPAKHFAELSSRYV